MMDLNSAHVNQERLVQLLWLAASCPGVSESLLHLVEECDGCFKPPHSPTSTAGRHLGGESLEAFGDRLFSGATQECLEALGHLVERCPTCEKATRELILRLRAKLDFRWESGDLDALTNRVSQKVAAWHETAPREKQEAPALGRQLLEQPMARRRLLIHNSDRFASWPLVDWLCEESKTAGPRNAKEAVDIAATAVEVAESLDPVRYGEAVTADIMARAWAYLGNAYRSNQELKESRLAFESAEVWKERGTRFSSTRAEILYLRSYLDASCRNFDKAHAQLAEAMEIYRELGDAHMEGRLRLIEANLYGQESDPDSAVRCLIVASDLIDIDREPRLLLVAKQNLALGLADLERYEEAEALLPSAFELAKGTGNRLDLLRLRWTEARIDAGLGRFARAEMTLSDVKESFKGLGLPFDAALAGLELANLYSNQGRTREIKLLALELVPVFAKNELHREALAAITLFARAAAAEEATVEVVQKTLEALKKAAERG